MHYSTRRSLAACLAAAVLLGGGWYARAEKAEQKDRPYLGVAVAEMKGEQPGVLLEDVRPEGPAGKAGLKKGDRIVMADGKEVKTFPDLTAVLSHHKPGDALPLKVVREGKEQTFTVKLGAAPAQPDLTVPAKPRAFLGVESVPLTPEGKKQLGVKTDRGAVVVDVLADSPAARAGLHKDDVITHVGNTAVHTPEELRDAIQHTAGKDVTLKVLRGKKELELKAHLEKMPGTLPPGRPGGRPEGVDSILPRLPSFFQDREKKVQELEKKVQELEKRIADLEKKVGK